MRIQPHLNNDSIWTRIDEREIHYLCISLSGRCESESNAHAGEVQIHTVSNVLEHDHDMRWQAKSTTKLVYQNQDADYCAYTETSLTSSQLHFLFPPESPPPVPFPLPVAALLGAGCCGSRGPLASGLRRRAGRPLCAEEAPEIAPAATAASDMILLLGWSPGLE